MKKILCAVLICGMILTGCANGNPDRYDVLTNCATGESIGVREKKTAIDKRYGDSSVDPSDSSWYEYGQGMSVQYSGGMSVAVVGYDGWKVNDIEVGESKSNVIEKLGEAPLTQNGFDVYYIRSGNVMTGTTLEVMAPDSLLEFWYGGNDTVLGVFVIDMNYLEE